MEKDQKINADKVNENDPNTDEAVIDSEKDENDNSQKVEKSAEEKILNSHL